MFWLADLARGVLLLFVVSSTMIHAIDWLNSMHKSKHAKQACRLSWPPIHYSTCKATAYDMKVPACSGIRAIPSRLEVSPAVVKHKACASA